MKRLFTFVICLTLSQITLAANNFKSVLSKDSDVVATAAKRDTLFKAVLNPAFSAYQNMFKLRLDSIQKEIPLDYNEYVQSYIDRYTNRKGDFGRVLGLAKYYFPIYEKAFREAGIPEEIKFLSIVESELNPNAVSRVGATGPWQFMYATGKGYGLNIDDNIDERRDPIQASYAAAAYIKNAYQEFGDWLLAIASYNCGTSSVERAIDKAGGATDFWSIRNYLPAETRGYVPAYIAASYVMNYFKKHDIVEQAPSFGIKTDTVMVNKTISLSGLASILGVDAKDMAILNPAYKRGVINGTPVIPRRLIVPQVRADKYSVLYEALNGDGPMRMIPVAPAAYLAVNTADHRSAERPAFHTVKRNETLDDIADRYGVEVQDLKAWNNLHSSKVLAGKKLKLSENLVAKESSRESKAAGKYLTYKVKRGDTLSGLAEKFEASVDSIKEINGLKKNALQPGMKLKILKV